MAVFFSASREKTIEIAACFAKGLRPGDTVLLEGEMGVGKTVFAKGVAKGLGVGEEVTSPTYAYMNEYTGDGITLYHYDCYRIESPAQAEMLGLADYFHVGGICLVEWAQNIGPLLPDRCISVRILMRGGENREIQIG